MVGMTKPFLMLTSRDDGPVLAAECADLPRFSGLTPDQVRQVRMERELPDLDLSEYSGAFVCGSPWDANADDHLKEERQVRAEAWLRSFYDRALGESFPILGLCYGLGTLTLHLGGVIDTHHGEEISGIALTKTDAGRDDPLLEGTPDRFHSYVGHHEAVRELAPGMQVLLAGDDTPIQMVRVGEAAWATQFHPEMDLEGVNVRIDQYAGRYYPVEKADAIRAQVATVDTDPSRLVLQNFVRRFQRCAPARLTRGRPAHAPALAGRGNQSASARPLLGDEENRMEGEGDKCSAHGNVRRHVVGIGADAVVRDITDDDRRVAHEHGTYHHPLAGPKCPVCARNVTRIARGADSEEGHGAGEHVVMQTVVPSDKGAADRVDERADQQC